MNAASQRIMMMIGRAIVSLADDQKGLQSLQLDMLDAETQDNVERFQQYGLTSVPHADAEAIVVCVGGLRSHGIVVAVDDRRYRLKGLAQGEVALYDDLGQSVHLARDGIRIVTDQKVTIESDSVDVIAETVNINATTASITAETVNLGGMGGAQVARVGDSVAGGKITTGSAKVSAA